MGLGLTKWKIKKTIITFSLSLLNGNKIHNPGGSELSALQEHKFYSNNGIHTYSEQTVFPEHVFIFVLGLTNSFVVYFLIYSLSFSYLTFLSSKDITMISVVHWRLCLLLGIKIQTDLFYFRIFKDPQITNAQCVKCKVRMCKEWIQGHMRRHSGRHEVKVKCEWMKRLILWEDRWPQRNWDDGVKTMRKGVADRLERFP